MHIQKQELPAPQRQRQEDLSKFETSQGYIMKTSLKEEEKEKRVQGKEEGKKRRGKKTKLACREALWGDDSVKCSASIKSWICTSSILYPSVAVELGRSWSSESHVYTQRGSDWAPRNVYLWQRKCLLFSVKEDNKGCRKMQNHMQNMCLQFSLSFFHSRSHCVAWLT